MVEFLYDYITDCYGQHWDERFAWDENMSAMLSTRSVKEHLSPFTLALLEDTVRVFNCDISSIFIATTS